MGVRFLKHTILEVVWRFRALVEGCRQSERDCVDTRRECAFLVALQERDTRLGDFEEADDDACGRLSISMSLGAVLLEPDALLSRSLMI